MNRQVIILFGPPGAGKGTQAELLSDKMGLFLFETSGIIEKKIAAAKKGDFVKVDGKEYSFDEERELWKKGKLWDPPFVVYFANEKIRELSGEGKSIIFAGSPRTLYEAQKEMPILAELYGKENIKIVLLEIKPKETIFRNSNRKICELIRHPILFNKETENLTTCPLDGSKLIKRKDLDDPETIKVRIKEYEERTLPMVEYFQKNDFKVHKVNGEQSVADVFGDVLKVIK